MRAHQWLGGVMALAGAAILVALGVAVYNSAASAVLVDLGIPGALLSNLAGLVLLFVGAALLLRKA